MNLRKKAGPVGVFACVIVLASGCSSEPTPGQRDELLAITQEYLADQVNTVTQNISNNRLENTNQLPPDRVAQPLADIIKRELPKIRQRRDEWRATPNELAWGRAKIVSPDIRVSGDEASLAATEQTELHYSRLNSSTFYVVDHLFEYVKVDGVWKISSDTLKIPPGAPGLEPYPR